MSRHRLLLGFLTFFFMMYLLLAKGQEASSLEPSMQDENVAIVIELNGRNIAGAQSEETAVAVDVDKELTLYVEWDVTSPTDLKLIRFDLGITYLDQEIYTWTYDLNIEAPSGSTSSHTGSQDLKPYLKPAGVQLSTGVFVIRLRLVYQVVEESSTRGLASSFYVRVSGNPLTTIVGAVAAAGTAVAAVTVVSGIKGVSTAASAANSINKAARLGKPWERFRLEKGISVPDSVRVEGSGRIIDFVEKEDFAKPALEEIFKDGKERWDGKSCPKCGAEWSRVAASCVKCGTTLEAAKNLFGGMIKNLSPKAASSLAKTTKSISAKGLGALLGVDPKVAKVLILTLADIGMAKATVSRWFILRSSVYNGLKIILTSLIWLQISGFIAFAASSFILMVTLGAAISFFVGLVLDRMLKGTAPAATCPTCGQPLTYVEEYKRWYCYNCKKYV